MAGESAREVARRQREKAARLARQAELWEHGADGEEATAALLDGLKSQGWRVFHDVAWPGRPRANIDHVLIGPGGVFVIDSKNWNGAITVNDDVLRQNGRQRELAVHGAGEAALAITHMLGGLPATGVMCFVRDQPIQGWARDVMICSTANLVTMVASRQHVLHPLAIERHARHLQGALRAAARSKDTGRSSTRMPRHPARPSTSRRSRATPARPAQTQETGRVIRVGRGTLIGIRIVGVVAGLALLASLVNGFDARDEAEMFETGESSTLQGADGRPTLVTTVTGVMRTREIAPPSGAEPGERLFAVRLTIENTGDRAWLAERAISVALDADPVGTVRPAIGVDRVRAGTLLAATPIIKPGRSMKRVVVFDVPPGSKPVGVRVQLDPLEGSEARWVF